MAAIEPNETVTNMANPSAVTGDDMTIGNWSAISTPHIMRIVKTVNSISVIDCNEKIVERKMFE